MVIIAAATTANNGDKRYTTTSCPAGCVKVRAFLSKMPHTPQKRSETSTRPFTMRSVGTVNTWYLVSVEASR
jgi:hypothetical protein